MKHYAVFWSNLGPCRAWDTSGRGLLMWCRATNVRAARRHARLTRGYVVALTYGHRDAWDAPTFRTCGDVVANYSERAR